MPSDDPLHGPEEVENYLWELHTAYPHITMMEPVGASIEGRSIWAFTITDNPALYEPEPHVRLTGGIHGSEGMSWELLLYLLDDLLTGYAHDSRIRGIIDNTVIMVIPMLNPDGAAKGSRYNETGVDLNRNFTLYAPESWQPSTRHGPAPFSEPETTAIRDYALGVTSHLSATFHTGAVVVNMPFDYAVWQDDDHGYYQQNYPAEHVLVSHLAHVYTNSGRFLDIAGLLDDPHMDSGTIFGGDWYVIYGSLQDWSYMETGCIDLTIETTVRTPATAGEREALYNMHRESLISYMESARMGMHGRVTSSSGEPLSGVTISIDGGDITTRTNAGGYYHRILLPGTYTATFMQDVNASHTAEVTVPEDTGTTEYNVTL